MFEGVYYKALTQTPDTARISDQKCITWFIAIRVSRGLGLEAMSFCLLVVIDGVID